MAFARGGQWVLMEPEMRAAWALDGQYFRAFRGS
jgi:hypothetical protein